VAPSAPLCGRTCACVRAHGHPLALEFNYVCSACMPLNKRVCASQNRLLSVLKHGSVCVSDLASVCVSEKLLSDILPFPNKTMLRDTPATRSRHHACVCGQPEIVLADIVDVWADGAPASGQTGR